MTAFARAFPKAKLAAATKNEDGQRVTTALEHGPATALKRGTKV